MDWSKAKTILIVAFIVTNLLLGFVIFSKDNKGESTIKESFIEDVIGILARKNIEVASEIPREMPTLNTLSVEYEIQELDSINKSFFKGQGQIESNDKDFIRILHEEEAITVTNSKILKYQKDNKTSLYKEVDKEKAKEIALSFLADKDFDISDMKLSFISLEDGIYTLDFSKLYNDRYLEIAYTRIEVDGSGVRSMERLWLNAIKEGDTPIYISTAPKAILDLLSIEEAYGKTIVDISLCYYFEPAKSDYVEEPQYARRGKSIPAWRVLFDDGGKIIIDNY